MQKQTMNQGGFSLIEVLIAIIVGAVGLLGIAALMGVSLKHTKNSVYRTSAVVLVGQLSDSIRANHVAKNAYATTNDNFSGITVGENELNDSTNLAEVNCYGKDNPCTPDELAGYDMYLWWLQVKTLLPDPKASIAIDSTDPSRLLLEISWNEQTVKEASDNNTGYFRSRHRLEIRP